MDPRERLDDFAPGQPKPMVIAHRGYSSKAPENTLAAFTLLCEHGINGVELDVHRCGSGEIVVIHDDSLQRVAGVPLPIATTPLAELLEHDVGRWFDARFAGERIPLLEDVFELLSGRCFIDIEIKRHRSAGAPREEHAEAQVARLVRRHGLERRCIVSSFGPSIVRRVRKLDRNIVTAIIDGPGHDVASFARRKAARIVSDAPVVKPHHANATETLFARMHRRERLVMPWTVDDEELARSLANRGADAIITNRPGEILEALRQPR